MKRIYVQPITEAHIVELQEEMLIGSTDEVFAKGAFIDDFDEGRKPIVNDPDYDEDIETGWSFNVWED